MPLHKFEKICMHRSLSSTENPGRGFVWLNSFFSFFIFHYFFRKLKYFVEGLADLPFFGLKITEWWKQGRVILEPENGKFRQFVSLRHPNSSNNRIACWSIGKYVSFEILFYIIIKNESKNISFLLLQHKIKNWIGTKRKIVHMVFEATESQK